MNNVNSGQCISCPSPNPVTPQDGFRSDCGHWQHKTCCTEHRMTSHPNVDLTAERAMRHCCWSCIAGTTDHDKIRTYRRVNFFTPQLFEHYLAVTAAMLIACGGMKSEPFLNSLVDSTRFSGIFSSAKLMSIFGAGIAAGKFSGGNLQYLLAAPAIGLGTLLSGASTMDAIVAAAVGTLGSYITAILQGIEDDKKNDARRPPESIPKYEGGRLLFKVMAVALGAGIASAIAGGLSNSEWGAGDTGIASAICLGTGAASFIFPFEIVQKVLPITILSLTVQGHLHNMPGPILGGLLGWGIAHVIGKQLGNKIGTKESVRTLMARVSLWPCAKTVRFRA